MTILGVVLNSRLTATDHVDGLMSTCSSLLYLMRVLRNHGFPEISLKDVFSAIVMSRLLYCAPAWSGFCTAADRERLEAFLRRCKRCGYCDQNTPRISDAEDVLFQNVLHRPNHVLQYLLQDREPTTKELIQKTPNLNNSHFFYKTAL